MGNEVRIIIRRINELKMIVCHVVRIMTVKGVRVSSV